jgi:uncharacterized tellurite resistance protein B-like protein
MGVGLEPDPGFGSDLPSPEDPVALFSSDSTGPASAGFGLAALLSRLAAAVAAADGDFSDLEAETLRQEILGNPALSSGERNRLLARLALHRIKAPLITGLKPTIERMNSETRLRVIDFLLAMVYANRVIAPGEVKLMEKIYTLFGLEASALYTRLHELAAGTLPSTPTAGQKPGSMQLDAAKVQQLKAASAEVTKKLAAIFEDQGADGPPEKIEAEVPELVTGTEPALLELDVAHAGLLTVLVGRAQWTRAEFEELCADKGLMPDGAIERINDAAFAKYDQPLIEGEDPLEVGVQLLEKI